MNTPSLSRRRLLGLGGGLAAAGALAACGGNTGRDSASTGTSGAGGKPTLTQWYHQYGEAGTQQAVEKYAAAYPDATVKVSWKPGDYDQTTAASLLTDSGPDVFEYGNGPTIDMIKGKQVVDLTDLLGDAKADFNPGILKRMTFEGKTYAIPQVVDMQYLVYRPSLLEKAGVQPPTSVAALMEAAKKLTTDSQKGLFVGNDGGAGLLGGPTLWSVGADYLTDGGQFGFANDKVYKALAQLHELFTSGNLLLGAPKDWFDASALTQGLAAMQFTGLWTLPDMKKALGDDIAVLPWPAGDGGSPSVVVGAYGSMVSAKAKDVEAAKKFVKWLWIDQTDKQLDFATSYGFHIPSRASLVSQAKTLKDGPAAEAAQLAAKVGHAQSDIRWTPKCATAFGDMMTNIVKSGADPKSEVEKVRVVAEAELKRIAS